MAFLLFQIKRLVNVHAISWEPKFGGPVLDTPIIGNYPSLRSFDVQSPGNATVSRCYAKYFSNV